MERRCLDCNKPFTSTAIRSLCTKCRKRFGQRKDKRPLLECDVEVLTEYFESGFVVKKLAPADAEGAHATPSVPLRMPQVHIPY